MERFGGQTSAEYLQQANDALVTVVQIETKEALENVCSTQCCEILGRPGEKLTEDSGN